MHHLPVHSTALLCSTAPVPVTGLFLDLAMQHLASPGEPGSAHWLFLELYVSSTFLMQIDLEQTVKLLEVLPPTEAFPEGGSCPQLVSDSPVKGNI